MLLKFLPLNPFHSKTPKNITSFKTTMTTFHSPLFMDSFIHSFVRKVWGLYYLMLKRFCWWEIRAKIICIQYILGLTGTGCEKCNYRPWPSRRNQICCPAIPMQRSDHWATEFSYCILRHGEVLYKGKYLRFG